MSITRNKNNSDETDRSSGSGHRGPRRAYLCHAEGLEYDYPAFHLTMHCFRCQIKGQRDKGLSTKEEGYTLLEHEAARWLAPKDLQTVRWLPADEEIINELMQ